VRALAALALLALAACSPRAQAPAGPTFRLDCAKGFEAQAAALAADPAIKAAPRGEGQPYRFFNAADGKTAWVVTEAGSAAHPAIVEQAAARENGALAMKNRGCAYGDRAGYDELLRYMDTLSAGRRGG
jgi:hypothetical protein